MAAQFIFSNNASTTLTSAITAGSTVINVASGAAFPVPAAGQQFALYLTDAATGLVHEVMYATSNASNQFSVTRAQEGTTATSWAIGDYVQHVATAGSLASAIQSTPGASSTYAANSLSALGAPNTLQENVVVSNYGVTSSNFGQLLRATLTNTIFSIPSTLGTGGASPFVSFKGFSDGTTVLAASGTTFGGGRYEGLSSLTLGPNETITISVAPAGTLQVVGTALQAPPFSGAKFIGSNYNAALADKGNLLVLNASALTVTAPTGMSAGYGFTISGGSYGGTLAAASGIANAAQPFGNGISNSGTTSLPIPRQGCVTIEFDGTNYIAVAQPVPPGLWLNTQRFTANGTYTPTPGTNWCRVRGVGGGGAGAGAVIVSGSTVNAAPGGTSGAFGEVILPVSAISGAAITIGAGGIGTASAGNNGTATTVGSVITFPGGNGGQTAFTGAFSLSSPPAPPGSVTTTSGYVNASSSGPATGGVGNYDGAQSQAIGGTGGSTPYGAGPVCLNGNTSANGNNAAANTGAGGSGAGTFSAGTAYYGGNGGSGYLIIDEYS